MEKIKFMIDYVPTTGEYNDDTTDETVLNDFNNFFKDKGIDIIDAKVIGSFEWPQVEVILEATDEAVENFFDAYNGKEDNDIHSIEELDDMYGIENIK